MAHLVQLSQKILFTSRKKIGHRLKKYLKLTTQISVDIFFFVHFVSINLFQKVFIKFDSNRTKYLLENTSRSAFSSVFIVNNGYIPNFN